MSEQKKYYVEVPLKSVITYKVTAASKKEALMKVNNHEHDCEIDNKIWRSGKARNAELVD